MTRLAPLAAEQYEMVARWLSKPALNRWLSGDWRDKETSATTIAIAVRNRKNRFFLISHETRPCGLVAFSDIDLSDKTAMVWYLLGEEQFGGKGIVSAAVNQLVQLGFAELSLASMYAWAIESNAASIRVLEKAGFRAAGRLRQSANLAGQQVDRLYFDIIRSDRLGSSPLIP